MYIWTIPSFFICSKIRNFAAPLIGCCISPGLSEVLRNNTKRSYLEKSVCSKTLFPYQAGCWQNQNAQCYTER